MRYVRVIGASHDTFAAECGNKLFIRIYFGGRICGVTPLSLVRSASGTVRLRQFRKSRAMRR